MRRTSLLRCLRSMQKELKVKSVDSKNFDESIASMKRSLKKGSFIGIDCEFSGAPEILRVPSGPGHIYEVYKKFCENYVIQQVGVAIFDEDGNSDIYSICVGPTDSTFSVGADALTFLVQNDYDLNKWITQGISGDQLKVIIKEVISARITLVGFQCFIDLMLCFRHLIRPQPLPSSADSFLSDLHSAIPIIIDIKHLIRQRKSKSNLISTYSESCDRLKIPNRVLQSKYAAHDAGVDAYMTAVCYLLFLKTDSMHPLCDKQNHLYIYGAPFPFPLQAEPNVERLATEFQKCQIVSNSKGGLRAGSLLRDFKDVLEIHWLVRNQSALVVFNSVKAAERAVTSSFGHLRYQNYEFEACSIDNQLPTEESECQGSEEASSETETAPPTGMMNMLTQKLFQGDSQPEDGSNPPQNGKMLTPGLRQMLQRREEELSRQSAPIDVNNLQPPAKTITKKLSRKRRSYRKTLSKIRKMLQQKDGQIEIFKKGMEGYKREATVLRTVVEELKKTPSAVRPDSAGPLKVKNEVKAANPPRGPASGSHSVLRSSAAVKAEWSPCGLGLPSSKDIRRKRRPPGGHSSTPEWYETQPSSEKRNWHELGPQLKKQNPRLHVTNGTWVISNFNSPCTIILDCNDTRCVEVRDCSNIQIVMPNFHSSLFQNATKISIQIFRFVPAKGEQSKPFPNNLMTTEICSDVRYSHRQYFSPRNGDIVVATTYKKPDKSTRGASVFHFLDNGSSQKHERESFSYDIFHHSQTDTNRFVSSSYTLSQKEFPAGFT